jgi:hypothetical protein
VDGRCARVSGALDGPAVTVGNNVLVLACHSRFAQFVERAVILSERQRAVKYCDTRRSSCRIFD